MIIDSITGTKYEFEKGNPFLVTGIEKRGRSGVGSIRRTYFAASSLEAKELAEKDGITVLLVTDLLKVDSDLSS